MKLSMFIVFFGYIAIVSWCDKQPTQVKIDLDLPPERRWVEACETHSDIFKTLALFAERSVIPKPLIPIINEISKDLDGYLPKDLVGELKGLANATQLDIGMFVLFNVLYDVLAFSRPFLHNQYRGCTSIVAQDSEGRIWHARNLDYGQIGGLDVILRNMTLQVDFLKAGKVVFTTTTYAGLVGVFTGQKPNSFTLSIDERDTGSVFENLYVLLSKNFTFTSVLARQVLERANSFEEAVQQVQDAVTPSPSFFIMAGTKPGEGAVVTRDRLSTRDVWRLNPANGTWFQVETNYDHWEPTPKTDNRREVAIKAVKNLGQNHVNLTSLLEVLSINPVLNGGTTYTTLMSAAQPGLYRSIVREP